MNPPGQSKPLQDSPSAQTPAPPSPRAFAIGTGATFQAAGGVLALAALGAALLSPWLIPRSEKPVEQWVHFLEKEHLPNALWTMTVIVSLIGGVALVAVGLGLQGERPSSGRVALVAAGLVGAFYVAIACAFLFSLDRPFSMFVPAILALVCLVLFLLAGHSASILKQFPPPPDLNVATPEILEEFRQKRLDRLNKLDP